jgi:predicted ATPase/DNA-binding SARP family transcriptional activator
MTTPVLAFGILGPLQVTKGGRALPLGGPKQRALLAALLLERNRVVARDHIVDALWGDRPPASAANSVHIYVSKLRRLLADGDRGNDGVLCTEPPGYLLRVPASTVDATEFERLLARGKEAVTSGAWAEAESILERALALWRGTALADLAPERFFQPEVARLEGLRLEALMGRVEALLGAGRHAEALAELGTLVAQHPLEERLRAQLMVAFYRAGRQADALQTYRAFRNRLAEDLGLEPTPVLRKLEQAILRQDASLGPVAQLAPRPGAASRKFPSSRVGTSVPIPSTPLVGRARELAETAGLLAQHRLLTLTGAGGSGKTRLALELATTIAGRFPDGVFWVPLQALRDPALVDSAIATAVGSDGPLLEHIGSKRVLMLLDNFEQVVAAAPTVSAVLAGTENARFLVTSRQPLELEVEQRYEVEPLADADAVVLFCQRARSVLPAFRPTPAVEEICRRLDGLPLAVELAAARTILLEPEDMLARLDARLPLLASRAPEVPDRHRTLDATIDWSYELLPPDEQHLFRRLAVFRGSFSVEAAEAVCEADLDRLESLVAKSLLRRPGGGRPVLLDTIREHALERLDESPEANDVRRRHAEFFLALAESANLNAAAGGAQLDIANAEQDNIRAALTCALESRDPTLGLALATAMDGFWVAHDPREGMRWFGELLALPEAEAAPPELRAHALRAYGGSTDMEGDDEAARRLYERSFELFEQLGDERGMATLLIRLAVQELRQGEVERARELVERSREMLDQSGDPWGRAMVTGLLGAAARDSGDAEQAYELIAESARLGEDAGVPWWKGGMLAELATLALEAGRTDEAEARARESLVLAQEIGDRPGRVFGVGLFAAVAASRGQQKRAEQLWAAVAQEDAGAPLGGWRRHRQDFESMIERHRGEVWHRPGQPGGLRLDDAVILALQK